MPDKILQPSANTFAVFEDFIKDRIQRETLPGADVLAATRACFIKCQYEFLAQRQPDRDFGDVIRFCDDLVDEVYMEVGVNKQKPTVATIQAAVHILDQRFEFMQDPEIAQAHRYVIGVLLEKMETTEPTS
jgi:hypothetical protein